MKKPYFALLLITCLLNFSAFAQKLPTAQSILDRYVKVIGGQDWITIKTSEFHIQLEADTTVNMVIIKNIPTGYYQKLTTPAGIVGVIYNNGKAVDFENDKIKEIESAKEKDDLLLQTYALPDIMYKKLGYTMAVLGTKVVGGEECYEVKLVSPNGSEKLNYYEIKTGYLKMADVNGFKSYFEDYQPINGHKLPFTMTMVPAPDQRIVFKVKSWQINKPVDQSLFVLPEVSK